MKVKEISIDDRVKRWYEIRLDQFDNLDEMETKILDVFQALCLEAERRYSWMHTINSDYREGDSGQHGSGNAIDFVFYYKKLGDVKVIDQFIFAVGFSKFKRIGFYPHWFSPGLHCDLKDETLYWWQDKNKIYHYGKSPSELLTWKT